MKRINIALILLIFAGLICSYEFGFVTKSCKSFEYDINRLEETYKDGSKEKALGLSSEIDENWHNKVGRIDMLLYHDYVDAITINIDKLSIYISDEDDVGFFTTCREIKAQIKSLRESEIPNLENII